MVQKLPKRRGRPPAYVPEVALGRAMDMFWRGGYAATSLDDLSAATGMNRPSLYGAFGDKRALYLQAVSQYWEVGRAAMKEALSAERSLRDGIRRVYAKALSVYFSGGGSPRGCFLVGTAVTEAAADPELRTRLDRIFREIDAVFEARIALAQETGELAPGADPAVLARLASATMYAMAMRSRSGASRAELEAFADGAVAVICGPAS